MWRAAPILYVLTSDSKSYAQRNWLGSHSRNTGSSLAKAPALFRAIMCGLAHSLPTLVLRCFQRRSAMEITAKAASPRLDSSFFDNVAIFFLLIGQCGIIIFGARITASGWITDSDVSLSARVVNNRLV